MTFRNPELLLLGPAAALLVSLALTVHWRRLVRLGRAYRAPAIVRLVPRPLQAFPTARMLCLVLASFALGAAAAGPRPAAPEPSTPPPPLDIAVTVDVSRSMGVGDVDPSRIERAREVVARLSESLSSARIVLILFADWPYTLVPPTDDPAVVRYFARSLGADLVLDRDQGTSFTTVLAHARAALESRPRPDARRAVLLISDGGAHEASAAVLDAATATAGEGIPVWTAGVGTAAGASIETEAGAGSRANAPVRPVVTRLEAELLREMARVGGGEYHDVSTDRGLRALLDGLGGMDDEPQEEGGVPPDAAFWLTLLAIPVLLVDGGLDAGRGLGLRVGRRRRA